MDSTQYIRNVILQSSGEEVEIHRCPSCDGVFGIDASFLDQVGTEVSCLMCDVEINISDPD
jgi:Zn-finger nucleic acid-binding protein